MIWNGFPVSQEFFDLTTMYQVKKAKKVREGQKSCKSRDFEWMLKSASVYVESATKECSSFEQLAPDMEDEEEKDGENNEEEEDSEDNNIYNKDKIWMWVKKDVWMQGKYS